MPNRVANSPLFGRQLMSFRDSPSFLGTRNRTERSASWKAFGRNYAVVEYDESRREVRRISVLEVSAFGVKWSDDLDNVEVT